MITTTLTQIAWWRNKHIPKHVSNKVFEQNGGVNYQNNFYSWHIVSLLDISFINLRKNPNKPSQNPEFLLYVNVHKIVETFEIILDL